jgi:hypothetical protein
MYVSTVKSLLEVNATDSAAKPATNAEFKLPIKKAQFCFGN